MKNLLTLLTLLATVPVTHAGDSDYFLSVPAKGAIMRVDADTAVSSTFAAGVLIPHYGIFIDDVFYVPDRGWPAILKVEANGNITALSAGGLFDKPVTIIREPSGQGLIVSDGGNDRILLVDFAGNQSIIADDTTTGGLLGSPDGLALDEDGNLYVANLIGNTITKIDPQGNATLFSDSPLIVQPGGVALDGSGNLFVAMYGGSMIVRFRTDTGEAEVFAQDLTKMVSPSDLKLARSGGLIASTRNSNIVRIDALGQIEVLFHDPSFGDIVGVSVPEDAIPCSGTFSSYGVGLAGSGGFTPELRAIFSPCPGMPLALEMRDFLGGAYSNLFVGLNDAIIPFAGSNVLVDLSSPFVLVPLTLPGQGPGEGDLTIPFILPDDPTFVGLTLKYHMLAADPGAPQGVSFSNGLSETIGS